MKVFRVLDNLVNFSINVYRVRVKGEFEFYIIVFVKRYLFLDIFEYWLLVEIKIYIFVRRSFFKIFENKN